MKDRFAVVILAAGAGTRFGGNKLNALVKNRPLYEYTLDRVQGIRGISVIYCYRL